LRTLERFPITWNHVIDKESLKFKELEHVLMAELAWLWQQYQPDSAQVSWFRERVSSTGRRMRKVMVVALARKLLIALWRFPAQGVIPEGAVTKPAP
jgi:hypothetical protein